MSKLRVCDPFAVDSVDNLFRHFLRPARWEDLPNAPQIKLDVSKDDKAYLVKAELPGVKKKDIHVKIDGNYVTINAHVKNEKDMKQTGKILRRERTYGAVAWAFSLASDVDQAGTVAKFENGLLNLTLPKKLAAGQAISNQSFVVDAGGQLPSLHAAPASFFSPAFNPERPRVSWAVFALDPLQNRYIQSPISRVGSA